MMRIQGFLIVAVGAIAMSLSGCGGGDDEAAGPSTIYGNVLPARAVTVALQNTDFIATSLADGVFIITGVPAGTYQAVFTAGTSSSTMQIEVPGDSTIELRNVRLSDDGTAAAESVSVASVGSGSADIGGIWDGVYYGGASGIWRGSVVFDVGGVLEAQAVIGELTHGAYSVSGATVTGSRSPVDSFTGQLSEYNSIIKGTWTQRGSGRGGSFILWRRVAVEADNGDGGNGNYVLYSGTMNLTMHMTGSVPGVDNIDTTLNMSVPGLSLCVGPDGKLYFPGGGVSVTQNGNTFTITLAGSGGAPMILKGTISGDTITGTISCNVSLGTLTVVYTGTFNLTKSSESSGPPAVSNPSLPAPPI